MIGPSPSWQALLDTSVCPGCGSPLTGPRCAACGVDLSGEPGRRLWQLSESAADALAQREAVLVGLKRDAVARAQARAGAAPAPFWPAPGGQPPGRQPPSVPTGPPAARTPAPATLVSRIGVQGLLVGVGALMIAVAGIVFLVFSWDRLSLGARAAVIAGITAAAMGSAAWLRPRLPETAEAIGAIGAVLVLADAWAVRATGLFGADRIDPAAFGALACTGSAGILYGWARLGRVRAGSITAAMAGPAAAVLAGAWLARANVIGPGLLAAELGLLAAALLAGARRLLPPAWTVERIELRLIAALTLGLAVLLSPGLWNRPGGATLVLALATTVGVLQAAADASAQRRILAGWSALAGATAAATAVPAARGVLELAGADGLWTFAVAPTLAAAAALAVQHLAGRRRPATPLLHRATTSAARTVALAVGVPSAAVSGYLLAATALASLHAWRARPGEPLSVMLAWTVRNGDASAHRTVLVAAAAVLGLAGFALLLAMGRPARWAVAVAVTGGLAAAALPVSPVLPLVVVDGLLVLVAVAAALFAVRADRLIGRGRWRSQVAAPAGLIVAAGAGTEAVLLSWTVRELSVPITAAGVLALLVARRPAPARLRPVLTSAAVLATTVVAAAGAGLLGRPVHDRLVVAALAGALLAGLLGALPSVRPLSGLAAGGAPDVVARERFAGLLAGLLPTVPAAGSALLDDAPGRLALVLAAALLAALAGAARPSARSRAGRVAPVVLAAAVPLLASGAAAATTTWIADPRTDRLTWVLIGGSAAITCCGLALGLLGLRTAPSTRIDGRRLAAEVGALPPLAGLAAGVIGGPGLSPAGDLGWWVLLLLGVGVTAAAVPADRRRIGWLGWALLTASNWYRLSGAHVGLPEAYTVPPALALLAVSAVRLRRDRSTQALSTLLPGLSLGLAPSVIEAAHGPALRPAVLIGLATLGVLLARAAGVRLEPVLSAAGAVVAGSTAALRSLHAAGTIDRPGVLQVEVWSACGGLVVIAAAWLLINGHREWVLRMRGGIGVPPLALAVVPTLVAAAAAAGSGSTDDARQAAVQRAGAALVVAGAVAVAAAWSPRPAGGRRELVVTAPLRQTALGLTLVAALLGWSADVVPTELWSVPVAAVLLALGAHRLATVPAAGSWQALGAGLLVLLLPPLMLSISDGSVWRIVATTLAAAVVLVVGAVRRLQAPAVAGAVTLAAHAVFQLGPWVVRTAAGQPRWVVLGLVGAALLVLGATYERRLSELRAVRLRLVALR